MQRQRSFEMGHLSNVLVAISNITVFLAFIIMIIIVIIYQIFLKLKDANSKLRAGKTDLSGLFLD